jgi:hypothetical protein
MSALPHVPPKVQASKHLPNLQRIESPRCNTETPRRRVKDILDGGDSRPPVHRGATRAAK